MATTSTIAESLPRPRAPFPARHPSDHAAISVAWLALLTSHVLLIRNGNVPLHRKLGIGGAVLAAAVVLAGLWAALTFEGLALDTPKGRPPFLAIEWSNIIEFGGLAIAAVSARKWSSAHKRLILLATLSLTPAAFSRAIGEFIPRGPSARYGSLPASGRRAGSIAIPPGRRWPRRYFACG